MPSIVIWNPKSIIFQP